MGHHDLHADINSEISCLGLKLSFTIMTVVNIFILCPSGIVPCTS